MRVQVDGQADLLLEGGDELLGGIGLEQAGHVLDGQHVRAALLELLGEVDVILQRVFVLRGIENIAGIAHGGLEQLVLLEHLVHGDLHAGDPVQRVEYAEHVDTALSSLLHEGAHKVIGIVGIADEVRAAQQHLERDVGDLLAQQTQALPRGLVQEAVGHVERRAAPHLEGEAVAQDIGHAVGTLDHVARTHTGGQQALMRVAHRCIGQQELLLVEHPLLHGLGPLLVEHLLQAGAERLLRLGEAGNVVLVALGVGRGHLNLGDVLQHAGRAVAGVGDVEQLRRLVNELRVALAVDEGGVGEDVRDEGDVRLDAAHAHLVDGAGRLAAGGGEGAVPAGDLDEQRVVVGGDDGADVGVAAIETHAEAARGGVGRDLAVIGGKVVGGILGGDAALDGVAVHLHVLLAGQADDGVAQGVTGGDQDLGADDVDARDHLGNGVLHLNAGIHLNKVVVAVLVDEELHSAGADVADRLGDLDGVAAQGFDRLLRDGPGGGELDDLLIAALQGAVALTEVIDVAVLVGEDLHLDVLRLDQVLLHKDVAAAEGLLGLTVHQLIGGLDLLDGVAAAHAAAAAAGSGLEDDGEAEAHGLLNGVIAVLQRLGAAGDDRHAALDGDLLGAELIAHFRQHVGRRADEENAVILTGTGKLGVLGQEAVAGVDGGHAAALGQTDDAGNIQIGTQRGLLLADQIGLVGSGAEEGVGVLVGVDGNRVQAQIVAGAENTHCDLAAVGHQNFFDLGGVHEDGSLLSFTQKWVGIPEFHNIYYTCSGGIPSGGKTTKMRFWQI